MPALKRTLSLCLGAVMLQTVFAPGAFAQSRGVDLYGYLAWRLEKVWGELDVDGTGATVTQDAPREVTLPSFNVMMQYDVSEKFKTFVNLNGSDAEDISVNNLWAEYSHSPRLNIRLGKSYRRFGLYNELLDAVPTYIGIEPPELFDNDHLILSRTNLLMVHGWVPVGDGELNYSVSTDNGEGGPSGDDVPIGWDLRYDFGFGSHRVGLSGYDSGGETTSDVGLGDGSPRTGVLPWMAGDDFSIIGGYGEFQFGSWQVQFAHWNASHDARRDADSVVQVINNAGLNTAQLNRFMVDPAGAVVAGNIDTNGDYDVTTWYMRAGYSITTDKGQFVPYFQWDEYDNPETIASKTWGGDNEAGLSDNGKFTKVTIGAIYRPVPEVAVKIDASTHIQDFNGSEESYSEIRFDISYIFGR